MSILQVNGKFLVEVDDVDIEQACIENPQAVKGFSVGMKAMVAALLKEDVKAIVRELRKCYHTAEYISVDQVHHTNKFLVEFMIRKNNSHETVAGNDN